MKRIRIAGLCFVAMFALSAMVTAAAQAGEYGRCLKAEKVNKKYTGGYVDKNCQTVSATHEGKYEWYAGVTHKVGEPIEPGYTSKTIKATLASSYGIVECKASTDIGEITGPKADVDLITFTGCEMHGAKCNSAGQVAGTIKTNKLDTSLIDHGEQGLSGGEPALDEVWTQYVSAETYQAEFECPAVPVFVRVSGSLSGVDTKDVNVMSATGKTRFESGHGEQDLVTEVSPTGLSWEPGVASVETTESTTKGASEKWEIKAELPCEPYPACL